MKKALFHLRQFRLLLLVLLCALFSLPLSAQEAYVVQTIDKNTLIFCYDAYRVKRWGKTWGIDEKSSRSEPAWAGTDESPNNVVTKVEFDDSFKNYRPITTKSWFSYLKALTIIVGLQNLNTSAVTDMTRMFEGCSSLTYLNVFKFNTSSVTNMSEMFSGCSGLKELNVSNFNTSKVTDMNQMFYNCSGLKTIINPNIWRCEQSQDMFKGCTQLNGAVKYDGSKVDVTMANFETGYFRNPNPKAYVQLSEDEHTLTFFYDAYRKWRSGTTWDIDKKSNEISWKSTPIWAGTYESPNNVITKVVFDASFKDFRPSTTENWFYNLSALTTIKGLENLNTSAVTDMRNMFYNCSDLEELNVSNFNTSAVTDMRNMFYNCSDLKELNVSNFNTSAVTDMSEMFRDCSGLTELNVSNFNTSKVRFMSGMFSGCSSLTYLNVSNFNTSAVTSMWDMFNGCSALKTIFNTQTWQCEQSLDMFKGCTQLHGAVWYDKRKVDATMADPTTGYFTKPNPQPYVLQSRAEFTLTFFCDAYRKLRSGTTWDIDEKSNEISWKSTPAWARTDGSPNNVVTKVVFDASFKDFRPTTTNSWFYNLSALTTIEGLENLNTSAVTDMSSMFSGCSSLTSLNLSNLNTSAVTSMRLMFYGCSSLTSLNLSNFNTSAVTDMRWMFSGCSGLKELNVSNFNTSAVTDMSSMFSGCSVLKELNVSNFNTSAVTYMSAMFSGCSGLTSLNLSNFNTSKVTSMNGMFSGCSGLKELNVSNFNTSAVTDMSAMFFRCSSLKELNVSNFNTSAVTSMNGMFSGCPGLKELNVSNFNTSAVTDMRSMFSNCSGLKELNVSNFNTSAVTDMRWMFFGCSGLKAILNTKTWRCERSQDMFKGCTQLNGALKFDGNKLDATMANPTTGYFTDTKESYVLQSEDQHTLTFYYDNNRKLRSSITWDIDENSSSSKPAWAGTYSTPNKAVTKVVFDASFKDFRPTTTEGWFYHLSELTTIEGLENLNTSKVTDMRYMFEGCSGLTSLNISNFSTSAVTDMGSIFEGCSSLTSLNLSNFNTSEVTDMSRIFYGCSRLTELNLSNFNTSAVTDMSSIFSGCSVLKELNVSNFNTSAVTDMRAMFKNCSSLTSLNVFKFNTSSVTNMSEMFSGCSGLTSLNVSKFNTSAVTNMSGMFTNCSGLKTILNPHTWRCEKSQDMFKGCTQLNGAVKYDASKLDVTMANPSTGYFRDPNKKYLEAYVLQGEDQHTLTFYYDYNRKLRSGKTWDIDQKSSSSKPAWAGTDYTSNKAVTKVVFDASFKDFSPTTTEGWFYHLSELTTIEGLENLNTSAVTDMNTMFSGCSSLMSLNLSNFNTSAVTNMSEMFSGCSSLKTIFNTVTWRCEQSQDMFKGCTQLNGAVKYDASKLDVTMANPTTGYFTDPNRKLEAYVLQSENQHTLTFYYDNNRKGRSGKTWGINEKTITSNPVWAGFSSFNYKVVTKVVFDASFKDFRPTTTRSWFYRLSALTTIEGLENLNTSAVTNMRDMFSGCSRLTSLNLSNFNTSAVTDMERMFLGCSGLKELNVSNFNTSKVTDMSLMFSDCSGLTSLNVSNFNTSKVTDMSRMFFYCSGLTELNVSNFNTSAVTDMREMFSGCFGLKELNVSNFNTSAVTEMSFMFYGCSGLTELNLSNFSTSAVTDMGYMFYGCSGLTELNVSNFNTSAVTNMGDMFYDCSRLTSLNISNFNTSKVTNMILMFYRCSGLTSLNVSNFNTSKVTNMGGMFEGCFGLTELNVSNFNTSMVTYMDGMFEGCSGLKTILNPNIWRCEKSQYMFYGCTQLKGAVKYDASKLDVTMANPETGYFSRKLPTAIGRVVFDDNNATQIYNLQGKRVNGNQQHLPAGFYIVNGKKVYLNEKP